MCLKVDSRPETQVQHLSDCEDVMKEFREGETENALSVSGLTSVAALCAPALEEGREGPQPVKATSTNCVIDHSSGQ